MTEALDLVLSTWSKNDELEQRLRRAETENHALKVARDALKQELKKQPETPSIRAPEYPRDEAYERLAVDDVTAWRAKTAALQQMVRKLHTDLQVARAENRRDQEVLAELQEWAEEAQRAGVIASGLGNAAPLLRELSAARAALGAERGARRAEKAQLEKSAAAREAQRQLEAARGSQLTNAPAAAKNTPVCAKDPGDALSLDALLLLPR